MISIFRSIPVLYAVALLGLVSSNLSAAQSVSCTAPVAETPTVEPVHMVFGGDIVLGNSFVVEHIPKSWDDSYFAGVRSILKHADLAFGNFEDTLTDNEKTSKNPASGRAYAFRSPPQYAELLYKEGFRVVNVANNHANDFGDIGFKDTLNNLKQAGIAVTGIRDQPATLSIRGLNIAMLGFAYVGRFNTVFDLDAGAELVRQAKARGDFVIVTFHGGAEGSPAIWNGNEDEEFLGENRGNTVAFSRAMIDAGADMVVGHGPHVLRAAECYQGKPIVYSLGNFVGVGGLSAKNFAAVSALLQVDVAQNGNIQNINLVPLRFDERKLPQLDPREYGTRLVNYLGQHAHFDGTFIEFPLNSNDTQNKFLAWFNANNPPILSAEK
jgi:hypothetical protein